MFVVEDSPAIRDLLIRDLTRIPGVELAGVADGECDALAKLSSNACDVLILDIGLRQGNGMSLLRTLAGLPEPRTGVNIIFTNHVSEHCRRTGERYGAKFFFDKSSDFLQLRSLVVRLAMTVPA